MSPIFIGLKEKGRLYLLSPFTLKRFDGNSTLKSNLALGTYFPGL
jgi:hypothetical protein